MGYVYPGSLTRYKTACLNVPGCDWLKWNGYDGMLFVVNFRDTSGSPISVGYYAICFPNPVSSVAPKYAVLNTANTKDGNYITQTCLGVAYTAIVATTYASSRWSVLTTLVPFYFINDPTSDPANLIANCLPSATLSGCSTGAIPASV